MSQIDNAMKLDSQMALKSRTCQKESTDYILAYKLNFNIFQKSKLKLLVKFNVF